MYFLKGEIKILDDYPTHIRGMYVGLIYFILIKITFYIC